MNERKDSCKKQEFKGFMKCISCLGLVVRLNSFRGFNLAHTGCSISSLCHLHIKFVHENSDRAL